MSVPSIAWVDWEALRKAGFEGCVFDKDNTLTEPYADEVAPQLLPSLRRCQQAFGGRLVLFSNSAGLAQFDPRGAATPWGCKGTGFKRNEGCMVRVHCVEGNAGHLMHSV